MGVAITELLLRKEIEINELAGKVIAVDSPMWLYQFLSIIRARDGTALMDSKGNITSHLVGLFNRTTRLMQQGLKLAFVFDGKPPKLKEKERERRKELKLEAEKEYKKAKEKEDIEAMKKYAARTARLTPEMIKEAKKLIEALGLPIVNAPCEGEAQAAYMVKKDKAFGVASQDADSLLFSASKLIRNLSIAGKRKKAGQLAYEIVKPEIIDLAENLNNLGIDNDQLIALGMLIGTDYNPGGVKGIGPKNALKLVKEYGSDFDSLFKKVEWKKFFKFDWTEIFYLIKKMEVTDKYKLKCLDLDKEKIIKLLIDKHDFSEERVDSALAKLEEEREKKKQTGLDKWVK